MSIERWRREDGEVVQYLSTDTANVSILMGLNQSYFMCAFFFISGYFTVSGFKKRGRAAALLNKLKRLGIPFLVYLYGLGPLLNWVRPFRPVLNMFLSWPQN